MSGVQYSAGAIMTLSSPPSLLSKGYRGPLTSGVKDPGREADHLPPSSAEVKNTRSYISIPPTCLHCVVFG